MLVLKNLTVFANNKKIINNLNYSYEKNKIYTIMGPNGSGKSTLAYAILGHPNYQLDKGSKIIFQKKDITDIDPDKRAKEGIFLSFQMPLSLTGINVFQLLRVSLSGKKDPIKLKKEIDDYKKILHIKDELIYRSLNEGASGGEKKKIELLQAAILNPKLLILDEIDTGVDVDGLKKIAQFLYLIKKEKTIILITHYNRILKHFLPDKILILVNGQLVDQGDRKLAEKIEKDGYKKYFK